MSAAAVPSAAARWLVVSPHCDDAVLSLGATLSRHQRAGGSATVVTVLAGDPDDPSPAGPWDRRAGFRTAGEAAASRRREDERACWLLGADVVHLAGCDQQYLDAGAEEAELALEIRRLADGHDAVFVPGSPNKHPDHRRVADLALSGLAGLEVHLYGEEPYLLWSRRAPSGAPAALAAADPHWQRWPAPVTDRLHKLRAVRCYRSQLAELTGPARGRRRPSRLELLARLWGRAARGEWVTGAVRVGPRDRDAV